ncbi:MAG: aspartate/glutamate racemase family protein [Patescibacteria group bacterium]
MIGIFDSGSGGLTVLRAIRKEMPSANIVYFADLAHAPYGSKSRGELTLLTLSAIERLQTFGASRVVSACNSVSASLVVSLYDTLFETPNALVEMVGPTVSAFRGSNKKILLCATEATIHSEMYQNGFRMIGEEIQSLAIPLLAGAIESGTSHSEIKEIIRRSLEGVSIHDITTVILACTHYPLAIKQFQECLPPSVVLYDPAVAVARRVKKWWWPQEVGDGSMTFLLSKDSLVFREFLADFFPNDEYHVTVVD